MTHLLCTAALLCLLHDVLVARAFGSKRRRVWRDVEAFRRARA